MKVDGSFNRDSLALEASENAPVIARINDYLARTALPQEEFAWRIGYSKVTLRFFLAGSYHNISRSARSLVNAATKFMDDYPIAPTTRVMGDLYQTENVRTIQDTFEKLLPRPVAYMLYAPPGSQKSFVLEHQVAKLNTAELANPQGRRAFYVYSRAHIRPRDLMRRVAVACGCRATIDIDSMLSGIRFDFQHQRVLLVVDEAQHLDIDGFETLRELLDQPPYFSLLFSGSHDLKRKFDEFSATLEQWNSRIIAKVRLPGLQVKEAHGIIEREIGHLMRNRSEIEVKRLAEKLVQSATVKDAFENDRTYINVRTLTNALDQIKTRAAEEQKVEAIA